MYADEKELLAAMGAKIRAIRDITWAGSGRPAPVRLIDGQLRRHPRLRHLPDSERRELAAPPETREVAVAATDHNDHVASFSNYGATSVDVAAPGVNILSTTLGGNYG